MFACASCGGLVHADLIRNVNSNLTDFNSQRKSNLPSHSSLFDPMQWTCRVCCASGMVDDKSMLKYTKTLKRVLVSAAFRYLSYELACMNIKTQLSISDLV